MNLLYFVANEENLVSKSLLIAAILESILNNFKAFVDQITPFYSNFGSLFYQF
jgi:hypothetical protein